MACGLGHFIGLDTHDVGGYPRGVVRLDQPGITNLRTTRSRPLGPPPWPLAPRPLGPSLGPNAMLIFPHWLAMPPADQQPPPPLPPPCWQADWSAEGGVVGAASAGFGCCVGAVVVDAVVASCLEERMVLTVEPGLYFNGYQMDKGLANPAQACFMNKERIDGLRNFGGVRIEDMVRPALPPASLLTAPLLPTIAAPPLPSRSLPCVHVCYRCVPLCPHPSVLLPLLGRRHRTPSTIGPARSTWKSGLRRSMIPG